MIQHPQVKTPSSTMHLEVGASAAANTQPVWRRFSMYQTPASAQQIWFRPEGLGQVNIQSRQSVFGDCFKIPHHEIAGVNS